MTDHVEGRVGVQRKLAVTVTVLMPVCVLTTPRAQAQAPAVQSASPATSRPSFEAVSVKPNRSDSGLSLARPPAEGRYSVTNADLRKIITVAYQLKPHQIMAAPEWDRLLSERFDIEAKAEGNPSKEQMWLMVQSLLADRFKLAAHHETRQLPVYALVLARTRKMGPGLKPHSDAANCADPAGPPPSPPRPGEAMPAFCGGFLIHGESGGFRETGNNVAMDKLASALSDLLDRPVVERTGLTGVFDVSYEAAFEVHGGQIDTTNASDQSGPPSIFAALPEQLGLKLELKKLPVDVLVIDHVEQPSPN